MTIVGPIIGQGQGFQLFYQKNNQPGEYSDSAERDVYFGANPDELLRLEQNQFLIIKLEDGGAGKAAYQQYIGNDDWVDVTSLIQGETGPAGATGNSYFFESIQARDDFFYTSPNEGLLMNRLPVMVNIGNDISSIFVWGGPSTPVAYEPDLWRLSGSEISSGTLYLGQAGAGISSGSEILNFTAADGGLFYVQTIQYDDTGSSEPSFYKLPAIAEVTLTDVSDQVLTDPQTIVAPAFANVYIKNYTVIPATSGEMRVRVWLGTDATGPSIVDTYVTVEPGDIGVETPFEAPNNTMILAGQDTFTEFSGVQLRGGVQTLPPFTGQTTIFLKTESWIPSKRYSLNKDDSTPETGAVFVSDNSLSQTVAVNTFNVLTTASNTRLIIKPTLSSGQALINLRSAGDENKYTIDYNETLDDVIITSGSGVPINTTSGGSLSLKAFGAVSLEALGNYTLGLVNDEAVFTVGNSATNYALYYSNTLDNTVPIAILEKTGISGGIFKLFTSTVSPEGVIPSTSGGFCVRTGANANVYLKLTDTGNTGWSELLHANSGVQGPVSSTDNAISTWNGTDALNLNDSKAFVIPTGADTRLYVDTAGTSGQASIGLRTNASSDRFLVNYNQTLNLVSQGSLAGAQYLIESADRLTLESNDILRIEALGNYNVSLSNDQSTFTLTGSTGGYSFSFSNTEPNTEPILVLAKDDVTGGVTRIYVSNTSPEGVILANNASICPVSGTSPNIYFKLTDGVTTGWQSILGDVIGPSSSTDNAIVTWDGTDSLKVQNSYSSLVSTASSTLLSVDNVSATGDSGFQIRNNTQNVRYSVTYNQSSNTVLSTTTSGASYTGVYDGSYQQETFSNIAIGSFANQLVEFYNSISLLRIDVSANGGRLYFNNTTADTFEMLRFIKGGTNGGTVDFYVTSRSPLGNLIANGGGFAFRDSGVNSNFYVKRVDGGTTGWNVGITKASESSTLNALAIFDVTTGNSVTDAATATLVIDTNSTALELKPVTSAGNAEVNFRTSAGFIQSQIYYDEDVSTFNIEAQTTSLNIGNFAGPIKFASSSVDSAMYLTNTYPVAVLDGNPGDINIYINGASSEKFMNKGSVDSNRVWSKFALDSDTNAYGGFGRLQNRVRWSEDLTQSTWVDGLGNTTIIPGATTGPNGELVDNVQWDSTGLGLRAGALGTVDGNNYTVSFWAKHISGTNKILIIDINDGGATGLTIDSNEWQRYHASLVAGPSGPWLDITHNGTSTFAIWGVQVNDGIEVFPYLKTEDIARKDTTDYGLAVDGKIIFSGSSVDSDHITTNLTTGVLDGGTLSINGVDDSLIDVTAGSALIVDYSVPGSPNIRPISWDAQTVDPVLGATEFIKWIGVQESATAGVGEFVFDIEFTQLEKRTIAIIGRCWGDGVTDSITDVGQYTTLATGQGYVANDLSYILGSMNKRGNVFSANGANLLLNKSIGLSYRYAANVLGNPTAPHVHPDDELIGITTYWYLLQNSLVADIQPDIDPDNWDNGGTKTAVPTGKYTLQRLYYFPVSQLVAPTYGQELFDSMGAAIGAAGEDIVDLPQELLEGAILRGWIALKQGATALFNDPTQALFKEARSVGDYAAKGAVGTKNYSKSFSISDYGSTDANFIGGFIEYSTTSTVLTIGGTVTQVFGDTNRAGGYKAFCVVGGATGGANVVTVSGASTANDGTLTLGDSEVLIPDTTAVIANQYLQTTKEWVGPITYTLTGPGGTLAFNYGVIRPYDFLEQKLLVTDFVVDGKSAANVSGTDIIMWAITTSGWTYSAGAFTGRPSTKILSMADDYGVYTGMNANGYIDYKRRAINYSVDGSIGEGVIIEFNQVGNNSLYYANFHLDGLI